MKNTPSAILLFFICLAIFSCKKNSTTETPYLGYSYFPDNVGHYIIYDVDSVEKDGFTGIVTHSTYQIKEIIESVFTDNQGRPTLRIERYRKDSVYYPDWTIYNVWTANLTATTAERFENNIRYIKLTFPVQNGKTWNGNAMNTDVEEDYEYTGIHEQMTINNLTFDSVTTVLQADELFNFVSPKYKQEQYAAGVGLVYRKKLELQTQIDTSTGLPDTSSYIDYTERINAFGN
ncbi:MAG: hypothetical protein ABI723_25485 [Bacteroidia bacterium]